MGEYSTNSSGSIIKNTVGRAHSTTIYDDFDMESSYRLDLTKYPAGVIQIDYEFDIEVETIIPQEIVENKDISKVGLTYIKPVGNWPDIESGNLVIESYINGQNNVNTKNYILWHLYSPYKQYDFNITHNPAKYGSWQKIKFALVGSDYYPGSFTPFSPDYDLIGTYYRVKGTSIINNDGTDKYISFSLKGHNPLTGEFTNPAFRNSEEYTSVSDDCYYKNIQLRYKVIENENLRITIKPYNGQFRSNYKVTSENVLDPSIDQAKFLIDYMKLFGLVCEFDKLNKNYVLSSRNKFFSSGQKVDWTYKVQVDKMEIEPTPIDARKYKFKWGDISATHYERYNKVFDSEYGSVLINTNNEHLDNTEIFYDSLFSCPLIEQSYNLDQYSKQYRLNPFKALSMCTYNGATRTEAISSKPTLIFFDGLEEYPLEVLDNKKNWMIISDDTSTMIDNNDFYWSTTVQSGETSYNSIYCVRNGVPVFPKFVSLIENVASLDFAVPKVVFYDKEVNSISDGLCIYNRFYEKFMNDKLYST